MTGGWALPNAKRKTSLVLAVKALSNVLLRPFFRLRSGGLEHVPREGPFVLLPKHQRWEDIPLLALAAPRPLYYIAKYELFSSPLSRWFLLSLGGIPLNRSLPMQSRRSLREMVGLLDQGEGIVVFPEGTYYEQGMGPGRLGLIRLILSRTDPLFVPVGIQYGEGRVRREVVVRFGRPLRKDEGRDARDFLAQAMEEVSRLSGMGCDLF